MWEEEEGCAGWKEWRQLAQAGLEDQPGLAEKANQLQASLDYDATFATSLRQRRGVLGYDLTSDRQGLSSGVLPAPVMEKESLQGRPIRFTSWSGFGSNIAQIAKAAPMAGYFNPIIASDGVVRSIPLNAEYQGKYSDSLSPATCRSSGG